MVLEYRKRSGIAMNEVIIQAQDLVKIYKSKKGIFCRKSSSQFAASRWRKGNISGKMYL